MSAYLLGLGTLPALAVVVAGLVATKRLLTRLGFSFEWSVRRGNRDLGDQHWRYVLRHGIWWERSWGPLFVGGWYREPPKYRQPNGRLVGRWIGVGRSDGPCWSVIKTSDLGPAA